MDSTPVKFSDAIAKLLSEDNRDKTLGEVGEDLSDYLVQIKEMVEKGNITYSGLMEEVSKYIDKGEIPKPNTVSQLLMGCVVGDEWCPLDKKDNEISFIYDPVTHNMVSISDSSDPRNKDTYAVIFLTGDPRDVDLDSFKGLEEKGFEKVKIKFKDVSESVYRELVIGDLEKHIRRSNNVNKKNNINLFMSFSFLLIILLFILFTKNTSKRKI